MTMDITTLNRKRGNIKGQITRISNAITAAEKQNELDIAQLQAHLDTVVNIHEKFEVLKNDYYRILTDDEFEEAEALLSEVDEDIEKLERPSPYEQAMLKRLQTYLDTEERQRFSDAELPAKRQMRYNQCYFNPISCFKRRK